MEVRLVIFRKDGTQRSLALPGSVMVIGRRSTCDLQVPVAAVSRKHCQLNRSEDELKIRDLGSRNGTFLNGERIDEAAVKAGDRVKVGPVTFGFQIDGEPAELDAPKTPKTKRSKKHMQTDDLLSDELGGSDILDELESL